MIDIKNGNRGRLAPAQTLLDKPRPVLEKVAPVVDIGEIVACSNAMQRLDALLDAGNLKHPAVELIHQKWLLDEFGAAALKEPRGMLTFVSGGKGDDAQCVLAISLTDFA
jgi:hypothetical protein